MVVITLTTKTDKQSKTLHYNQLGYKLVEVQYYRNGKSLIFQLPDERSNPTKPLKDRVFELERRLKEIENLNK